jgi:hypothetical protein
MSSPDKLRYLKNLCIRISDSITFLNLLKNSGLSLVLFKESVYARLFKAGEKFVDTIFCDSELYL